MYAGDEEPEWEPGREWPYKAVGVLTMVFVVFLSIWLTPSASARHFLTWDLATVQGADVTVDASSPTCSTVTPSSTEAQGVVVIRLEVTDEGCSNTNRRGTYRVRLSAPLGDRTLRGCDGTRIARNCLLR